MTTMVSLSTALALTLLTCMVAPAAEQPLKAAWIWAEAKSFPETYNQTIVARKAFQMHKPVSAKMRVSADTWYRLKLNGHWVNDGPCRSWPEHFQYDVLDAGPYLRDGKNEIEIVARFFGTGDFHHVPLEPGLIAQLDVETAEGKTFTVVTDGSWEVAPARAWIQNTPKVSIQMEPAEWYDARLEKLTFRRAKVVHQAGQGPWKNLYPRDVALLTRQPARLKSLLHAKAVESRGLSFCLRPAQLLHPGLIEANHGASIGCGIGTVLVLKEPAQVRLEGEDMKFSVDGLRSKDGTFSLEAGRHVLLAFASNFTSHQKHPVLRILERVNITMENPLNAKAPNSWCFLRFPDLIIATNDMFWIGFSAENKPVADKVAAYKRLTDDLLTGVKSEADFKEKLAKNAEQLPFERMFALDSVPETWRRTILRSADAQVKNPEALMHDTADTTEVIPADGADIELLYDLGEQNCGYYSFDISADEGVVLDIVGVEFIAPDGQVQWSRGNRNGLRYITKAGNNHFVSVKRRSGRYLFVTVRNLKSPARIRNLQLIESTYPVNEIGSFTCSDPRLDRVWEISRRTLKLCMEDTYTDCPLYEQTHWVGDARNESLYGYTIYGAYDIGMRCARQTAQSLGRFPITGAQLPSSWECLLPAWSFLWTISTWDAYWYTGRRDFLEEMHPAVIKNIEGAAKLMDDRKLFSGPFWNFFDWTAIDQGQKTVLHNSMLLVGAIDAALKAEAALNCKQHERRLIELREQLVSSINNTWNPEKGAYPDSYHNDGSPSPSTSQHTSILSVLYEIAPEEQLALLRRNIITPPEGMVRIGSPFAAQYQYEALEKLGLEQEIISLIYKNYVPMLEAGATTVWESFPSGNLGRGAFPTRSHCHAWSSAPLYFLSRIVLGLRSTEPGWAAATVSPRPGDLKWARGATATPYGPVWVEWKLADGNSVEIRCSGPEQVKLSFRSNEMLKDHRVIFNGQPVQ